MKKMTGLRVRSTVTNGRELESFNEVLEADRRTTRVRCEIPSTGDVWENLWSPENPTVSYDDGLPPMLRVRTWRNGDELPADRAGGQNYTDHVLCTVLEYLFGDDFTGYTHNYRWREGYAMPDNEDEQGNVLPDDAPTPRD